MKFLLLLLTVGLMSCNKENSSNNREETVITEMNLTSATSIKLTVVPNFIIASSTNYRWGVCYGNKVNPTLEDNVIVTNNNTFYNFEVEITDLEPNTQYYARFFVERNKDLRITYSLHCSFTMPNAAIGEYKEGGVVFWVDPNDPSHGLVCSVQDCSTLGGSSYSDIWSPSYYVTGATNTELGSGHQNTNIINSIFNNGAAVACSDYSYDGYTDWYLPNKDELNMMYMTKEIINTTANKNDGSNFHEGSGFWYWSSTEISEYKALRQRFDTGYQDTLGYSKKEFARVRAIRSF